MPPGSANTQRNRSGEVPSTPAGTADWTARTTLVMDHVRANLGEDLSLTAMAAVAGAAPHHFQRIFTGIVGESPAEFTRRVRVERAAHLMMTNTNSTLTRIAVDVGFPGLSDFSRSFRAHYGTPPSSWDRSTTLVPRVRAARPPVKDLSDQTRLIHLQQMRLAVVRAPGIIGLDAMTGPLASLLGWAGHQDIDADRQRLIGMAWDNHVTTPSERIHYEFGLTIPGDLAVPPPLTVRVLPATTAVAVTCNGPISTVADAWEFLYGVWFPARSHEPLPLPAMKLFRQRPDQVGWSVWDLDCAIAVRS